MEKTDFIRCPVCGNKTRYTVLKNSPSFVQNVKESV